jgi:hypothetical protein
MRDTADPQRTSPMEDGFDTLGRSSSKTRVNALMARAQATAFAAGDAAAHDYDYLRLLRDARPRLTQYYQEQLAAPIDASYRAFRNKHFNGSKYWHTEYRNRSKLFRPKTRTAVRKADAAAVAALFATKDAVKCTAGDESNPLQQANAKLIQALFNYRTDRTSGMAAIPWFRVCGGAHQDAMITSACVSKQYWKLELRHMGAEPETDAEGTPLRDEETGAPLMRDVYAPFIDRPDCMLFPLENIEIDPAAHWLNPIQSAAVFIAKVPMTIDEVLQMQEHPLHPWHALSAAELRGMASGTDDAARATRASREGTNRLDARYTGRGDFEIVWVYEVFMRVGGRDMTFWAAQDRAYLTDPKPVHEVYPEQGGERPYTFGVVNLESHRLFPMSSVESWQQSQIEINDFANLMLDSAKLAVSPIKKVVRGKQVDLAQLNRLGPNAQFLVEDPSDVTWDKPPDISSSAFAIMERLNNDFDTSSGNFDQSTVQASRFTGETVGGLQLISGSANAVTEFDQRVWIETWVEPTIAQLIKCIQYYESDATVLALCGARAGLLERFGVSRIDDELLSQQVTVTVDAGIGNADPAQKLQKLGGALALVAPLFRDNPALASGALQIDVKAIADEVFSLAGYRDGATRFVHAGQPAPNPLAAAQSNLQALQTQKILADIDKSRKQGSAALIAAMASAARADLGGKRLAAEQADRNALHHLRATELGHAHGLALREAGGADEAQTDIQSPLTPAEAGVQGPGAPDPRTGSPLSSRAFAPVFDGRGGQAEEDENPLAQLIELLRMPRQRQFTVQRGPDGRISGVTEVAANSTSQPEPPRGDLVV